MTDLLPVSSLFGCLWICTMHPLPRLFPTGPCYFGSLLVTDFVTCFTPFLQFSPEWSYSAVVIVPWLSTTVLGSSIITILKHVVSKFISIFLSNWLCLVINLNSIAGYIGDRFPLCLESVAHKIGKKMRWLFESPPYDSVRKVSPGCTSDSHNCTGYWLLNHDAILFAMPHQDMRIKQACPFVTP